MADVRFCVGFSSACKQAREGGGLPGNEHKLRSVTADGFILTRPCRLWLPPEIVRLIDALVRRLEHEDTLLSMNGGVLGATLCQAAHAGGLLDVRFLLSRGADVEHRTVFKDGDGSEVMWTALCWAADAGKLGVCETLLDAGAGERDQALYNASFHGLTPITALLLDCGADIQFQNGDALINSAQRGDRATAKLLLDRGADVNAQNGRPIVLAAQNGHLEMVRLLLDRGVDLHAQQDESLLMAAQNGHLEIVRLLLDQGANVHADNEYALHWARQNGHAAVVALLLERGAFEPEED